MLSKSSLQHLDMVHPDLRRVVYRCEELHEIDFIVTEGVRTIEAQKKLYDAGASQTMRSRHIPGASGWACAVDLAVQVGGVVRWDWPLYRILSTHMKEAARIEGVPLEWGGDWKDFKDGPHFQLPWNLYP